MLLIPGFMAGDLSLGVMAGWLRRLGYEPCRAGIRANVDCSARALERLEAQLERLADRHDQPVSVVGHSRGGSMARVLAVRRPDLVRTIICLGSPLTDQLAVHPLVRFQVEAVATLGTLGVHGLFTRNCGGGSCCEAARRDSLAPFPEDVAFTSVYSRSDGIVDWATCLDSAASHVEVRSSHCGMAVNADVFAVVGRVLAPDVAVRRHGSSSVLAVRAAEALAA